MSKKKLLSGRERELFEMAGQYEDAKAKGKSIYLDAEDLADLADWYAVHQQPAMAMEVAEYGLKLHPGNSSLLIEKAYLHLESDEPEKAKEIALQIDGGLAETKILKAEILLTEGKEEEAARLLATIENKSGYDNMVNVAYMYINMQYPDEAYEWLKPGIGKYQDQEDFLSVLADAYYGKGMLKESEDTYNKLIDINPYSALYWFGAARCYFDQQDYNKAIEACDYAIISDDEFTDAYLMKGHAYFYLNNEEKALDNFRIALKQGAISQCFIDTFIGLNKLEKGDYAEGYKYITKAIDNYGNDTTITLPALYANAGACLYKMGDTAQALHYWQKAHRTDPTDVDAYLIEGRAYLNANNKEECLQCWRKALEYAPYATTWHEIGLYCIEAGYLKLAQEALEKTKALQPDFYNINEKLAALYLVLNDEENFEKYNALCKRPMRQQEVDKFRKQATLQTPNEAMQIINSILDCLQ